MRGIFKNMQNNKKNYNKTSGFTLIELLIVIVIIGILAGVVISIIDPAKQQNRAKDANVQAAINKAALSAQSYVSAYGGAPDGQNYLQSLENAVAYGASCAATTNVCIYRFLDAGSNPIVNIDLPSDQCGTTAANAHRVDAAANQCWYRYERSVSPNFYIYGKAHGSTGVFRFSSVSGKIETCDSNAQNCI